MIELNKYIEHTNLKPDCSTSDIKKLCKSAIEYNFFGVCVNPCHTKTAKKFLADRDIKIITVVNFPLASNTIETTLLQTQRALDDGADEIDTVLNLPAFKSKDYQKVYDDIYETKKICTNHNLKVILETDLLTKQEIVTASKLAAEAGANFVKTSTGFVKNGVGAKIEDVQLMYDTVKPYGLQVKASGGIKDFDKAIELIEAGATRLGTSSGVEIMGKDE